MKQDPYIGIIQMMQSNGKAFNPPSIMLGEVVSPNPLSIKLGNIQIDKDNILIADYLLSGHIREYKSSSDKQTWGNRLYMMFIDALKQGDLLAILPTMDKQTYIVLCRVVRQ